MKHTKQSRVVQFVKIFILIALILGPILTFARSRNNHNENEYRKSYHRRPVPPVPTPVPVPIVETILINPASLSTGVVNSPYSQTITAVTKATGPFTWSVTSGSLPAGLTFSNGTTMTNTISGTPNTSGSYSFSIKVTNGTLSTTNTYIIIIKPVVVVPVVTNLVSNPSLEIPDPSNASLPQDWLSSSWGTNTTVFTYPVAGIDGQRAARIDMSSYTDGDARWQFKSIPVTPGDSYTFSDSYKSDEVSYVVVNFTNNDGTTYYLGLRTAPTSAGWGNFSESFQVPYKATTMTVYHLIKGNGSLTLDNYFLAKSTPKGFNKPIVTLTFDNGFEDNITTAIPLLDKYGMKVTYCYSTEYVEGRIPDQVPIVKAISSKGNETCSHSLHHSYDMTTLTVPQLDDELSHSQNYLQSLVGQPITDFLTPFGAYNDRVVNEIKKYYKAHRTTDEGYNTKENFDAYRLTVQNMLATTTMAEFQSWVNQAVKDKSWLILVYHRVASNPAPGYWDTPAGDFEPQLQIIKNSGITVERMDQALNELTPQL